MRSAAEAREAGADRCACLWRGFQLFNRMGVHDGVDDRADAPGVARADVNPRPLHKDVPDNGLIGCYSVDDKMLFATAWEPYQELFQGVGRCLHSDFRLGGLKPGKKLQIKGKVYLVNNDLEALLARYRKDFPEHLRLHRR